MSELRQTSIRTGRRVLNAATAAWAVQIPAEQQFSGESAPDNREVGALPVWLDTLGNLRIAVRTHVPEWAGDHDQIIVDLGALLRGIGVAVEQKPERR